MTSGVVVGAGPNGLAGAVRLARAGLEVTVLEAADEIGGGTRTAELTVPGLRHDICSAFHPWAVASPYLGTLPLAEHGLGIVHPPVVLAHPLDGGRAAALHRSLDDTSAALGADGERWRCLLAGVVSRFERVAEDLLGPALSLPRHPVATARAGLPSLLPAATIARRFRTPAASALWAGIAAHVVHPLERPVTASVGIMLAAAGHAVGWPVAAGGSASIAAALASLLRTHGGEIHTGVEVRDLDEVPPADVVLLDVSPRAAVRIAGERMPGRVRRALARWRYGPAAFKLDLAVEGGIPWEADVCRRAGTVHVGGTFEEIAAAERTVEAGTPAERPFVLVGQQYLADPSRTAGADGGVVPVWAYGHVPHRFPGDATGPILAQIERFAPGFRDRIVDSHVWTPAALEGHSANHVGGDIAGGASTSRQLIVRPRLAADPYSTGIDGVYLCSSATPPGPGVHGMCGYHAATSALRHLGVPT